MKCPSCRYDEDDGTVQFVGVFTPGQTFSTTLRQSCGLYICPRCNTVVANFDMEYVGKRTEQYKEEGKAIKAKREEEWKKRLNEEV